MGAIGYAAMAGNSLMNAKTQANALEAQGAYSKQVNERNASAYSAAADEALQRGDATALRRQAESDKLNASQKVQIAASGGSAANSEMAQNISENTAAVGAADMAAIKTNAWRSAFGLRSEAINSIQAGEQASLASQNAARNTMATGTMEAAGYGLKAYQALPGKDSAPPKQLKLDESKKIKNYGGSNGGNYGGIA